MNTVSDRLAAVHAAIEEAASRAGRAAGEIELVAVSKTHAPEAIHEALDAGQFLFGESRVQEARAKIPLLPGRARWHFIGHLQKNKVRHALGLGFELFHGVDSIETAREMNRIAAEDGCFPKVLIEVNMAAESSKFGFSLASLMGEVLVDAGKGASLGSRMEELLALERLQIEGLMTIAPLAPEAEASRPHFAGLRVLREKIEREFRVPLPRLSMGMSGDFAVAVEEGATLVRVGTAIFGTRRGKAWKPTEDAAFSED